MKSVIALALLVSGLLLAGMVSANMTRPEISKGERLWSAPGVRATVVYRVGNAVSIYVPEGNAALCKGDKVPIFRSGGNRLLDPSNSIRKSYPAWIGANVTSPPDLVNKELVGEVRISRLMGNNYAFGRLVVGTAGEGDLAAKPGRSCLAS